MKNLIENTLSKKERKELINHTLQDISLLNSNINNIKKEITNEKKITDELDKEKVNHEFLLKNKDYFLTYLFDTEKASKLDKKVIKMLGFKIRKLRKPECFYCKKLLYYTKRKSKAFVLLTTGKKKDYLFCSKECLGNWALQRHC